MEAARKLDLRIGWLTGVAAPCTGDASLASSPSKSLDGLRYSSSSATERNLGGQQASLVMKAPMLTARQRSNAVNRMHLFRSPNTASKPLCQGFFKIPECMESCHQEGSIAQIKRLEGRMQYYEACGRPLEGMWELKEDGYGSQGNSPLDETPR